MENLKDKLKVLKSKAFTLKTKKAILNNLDKIRLIERQLLDIAYAQADKYNNTIAEFTVRSFNKSNGEGILTSLTYGTVFFSSSNDKLSKSWHSHLSCIEYTTGQIVTATIKTSPHVYGVEIQVADIIGGVLNEAKYNELCNDKQKYSFFKYPNKTGVSGLFA